MPRTSSETARNLGSLPDVQHLEPPADYALANTRFNDSRCFRKANDFNWQFGAKPKGTAELARIQHCIPHPSPQDRAVPRHGIANGPAIAGSTKQPGEGDSALRDSVLIKANLVDRMVALPGR